MKSGIIAIVGIGALVIGFLLGSFLSGLTSDGYETTDTFTLTVGNPYSQDDPDNIKVSDLEIYANKDKCESEFISTHRDYTHYRCYIEDVNVASQRYYNGDGAESYQDEDLVSLWINCICQYTD